MVYFMEKGVCRLATEIKNPSNIEGYKPMAVPQAFKVIEGIRTETRFSNPKDTQDHNRITGGASMREQTAIEISGSSFALLVKNLAQTVQFYTELGFKYEVIGSAVKHHHVSRDKLTLILLEAREENEVRPLSSRYEEQYFDVYCYTNAVDVLAQEMMDKNVTFVRQPNYTSHWSEFTFRDINGYQITVGGEISK